MDKYEYIKELMLKDNEISDLWQWLKQYADGKRVNFASDFVEEAERTYKDEQHGKTD